MTASAHPPELPALPLRHGAGSAWARIDATILLLVLIASSDMLGHLAPVQSVVWLLCYGLTLLRIAILWPGFAALVLRNRIILAYPLACLASVLWSADPATSLTAALQLAMTVLIGLYLGWRYALTLLTKALFCVLTLAMVLSLLHWATGLFPWPAHSRTGALAGIFPHKNMLGLRASFGLVVATAILIMPRNDAGATFKVFSVVSMAVTGLVLILSQSATAILLAPLLLMMITMTCRRRIPRPVVAGLTAALFVGCALGPVFVAATAIDPLRVVLDSLGKDATLTGRTELWRIAQAVSAEHPLLGVGYRAFWTAQEFADERALTRHAGAVTSAAFHNFLPEIRVGAGWPALIAMIALLVTAARRLLRLFLLTGSPAAACGITLLTGSFIISLVAPTLFRAHEFLIMLLVILAVSAREDIAKALAERNRARKDRRSKTRGEKGGPSILGIHGLPILCAGLMLAQPLAADPYRLVAGDRVTLNHDLMTTPKTAMIDLDGNIRLPELGSIEAAGKSFDEVEATIAAAMIGGGYSGIPAVSVEIASYAPVVVSGLVDQSGRYDYLPGMSVGTAIALAGGIAPEMALDSERLAALTARRNAERLAGQIAGTVARIARLKAALDGAETPVILPETLREAVPWREQEGLDDLLASEAAILRGQRATFTLLVASWTRDIAESDAQIALLTDRIALKNQVVTQLTSDLDAARDLQSKGLATNSRSSALLQRLADEREDLLALETAKIQIRQNKSLSARNRDRYEAEQYQNRLQDLQDAEGRLKTLQRDYRFALAELELLSRAAGGQTEAGEDTLTIRVIGPRADRFAGGIVNEDDPLLPGDVVVVSAAAARRGN
ncbi:MAG: O-antigen ligase family protein [Thalassovita sp.]|nr:O-antigen ligase family protein [Thalassovita sp.]